MKSCTNISCESVNFFVNCLLHILILFTILSIFFIIVISKLESEAFKKEIKNLLGNQINNSINTLTDENKKKLKSFLENVDLEKLKTLFDKPSDYIVINNSWTNFLSYSIILFLSIILICIIVLLYVSCKFVINIKEIIIENLIIFIFVGAIEVCFFLYIAQNFVPVSPSLMVDTLINDLKKKFVIK